MNSFISIEQFNNKLRLNDLNINISNKYLFLKNIISSINYKEKDIKPALYKNLFINDNSNHINQNNDKKKLLNLSLIEFIKKNYKKKNELIIGTQNIKNNYYINPNIIFLLSDMKEKFPKKIIVNKQNNNYINKINTNIENEISAEGNKKIIGYQYKNSSFNKDLNNKNTNIKKEKKISQSTKRVKSNIERNRFDNNVIFGKNQFEERHIAIDYESAMNSNELNNNNIIYIRKKNKNKDIIIHNNKTLYLNNEENKNRQEKDINEYHENNHLFKKVQSLPDINMNNETKEKNNNKIKSSYIPIDINKKINDQRNEQFFKNSLNYLNDKNQKSKKVFEFIYDNNYNAEFHFLNIKFGLENQKQNKYKIYNINTDSENKEKEEVIVKAFESQLFLKNELTNNNNITNFKNNSIRNKYKYYKTTVNIKSTEVSKDNSSNNTNKKDEIKRFYKTKCDKFFFNKRKKNDNYKNDSKKDILNKHKKKYKDKFYNTTNGFFDFKNNKIIEKTPIFISRYNIKRKKNNNDDIIGLI